MTSGTIAPRTPSEVPIRNRVHHQRQHPIGQRPALHLRRTEQVQQHAQRQADGQGQRQRTEQHQQGIKGGLADIGPLARIQFLNVHAGGHERGLRGGLVTAHQGDHQLAIRGVLDPVDAAGQDVVIDAGLARDAAQQGLVGVAAEEGQAHDAATDGVEITVQRAFVDMLRFTDESARGRVLRVQEHPGNRSGLDHLPGIEHGNAIADATDHVHLVGDQHDGQAQLAVDLRQQRQHRGGGLRIERTGGFVAQQDLRARGQRAGNADALLLATGQLRRVLLRMCLQAHGLQQLGHARVDLRLRPG
ncbi:hypothetical protein G6F23_012467 [Rhizopus arrhizus]|nr:hypothetical protein G6F23_012467 [Rhizopus arrhizus]